MAAEDPSVALDFIRAIVRDDLAQGRHREIVTRFPPEPNGFLHIGHAKSICLNFGIARETGGRCWMRLDDTNPVKEDDAFVRAILRDVRWLGFDWEDRLSHASDWFEQIHAVTERLIEAGDAFVCSLSLEEIRATRGTLTEPGTDSPYRDRSVQENLDLFRRMRAGEFPDGAHVVRARIDMASPNINLRDPVLYRIRHASHQRTGDAWPIYPMYDFAHALSDAFEGITHSLCTLEFEDHRPLYDWVVERAGVNARPRQIEFSRLGLEHTVLSKRRLTRLVDEGHVSGWDDPRMPTLAGMRRRGYTPAAIRDFCHRIGVTKKDNVIEMSMLEHSVREDLEATSPRAMAVLDPVLLVIENMDEDFVDWVEAPWHPQQEHMGVRRMPVTRELWIEAEDFMIDPPRKYKRLSPGEEVRLRYGYIVRCTGYDTDDTGRVTRVRCTYDPDTRSGTGTVNRKVKGVIHWVSRAHGVPAEVRSYDRLFSVPDPDRQEGDFTDYLAEDSLVVHGNAVLEPELGRVEPGSRFQFERQGYFIADSEDHERDRPVFNRTVSLRDTWARRA
jgi:glutaminyl-tRNA synthetase